MIDKFEHKKFIREKLSPFPFCSEGERKIYVKINDVPFDCVEKNAEIHISLLNNRMLDYDSGFFTENNSNETGVFYSPYFYEFMIDELGNYDKKALDFLDQMKGEWLEAEFDENTSPDNVTSYQLQGTVIFGASPIEFGERTLVIKDELAPPELSKKVAGIYNTFRAQVTKGSSMYAQMSKALDLATDNADYSMRVYNVGQGNFIYIYGINEYGYKENRILFDIGLTYQARNVDWKLPGISKSRQSMSHIKPHISILSHWDMDHIIGVSFANPHIFDSAWIAPDLNELSTISLGALRLARYLCWRNKLHLIDKSFINDLVYTSPNGSFKLWRGSGINNTKSRGLNTANNFGLIIEIKSTKSALLSGDCEYSMMSSGLNFQSSRYDYFVVPHHCSEMPLLSCRNKSDEEEDIAIISAGTNSYKPTHPYCIHMDHLKNKLEYKLIVTKGNDYRYLCIPTLSEMDYYFEYK